VTADRPSRSDSLEEEEGPGGLLIYRKAGQDGDHLLLQFGPRRDQHLNYLAPVNAVRLEDYDLFCKIDDDDVYIMPPTAAFSRRAIERISKLDLAAPPAELRLGNAHEDVAWGRIIARAGLPTRVRSSSRFTYHVHGGNLS
jgi:hypothetical protein